MRLHRSTLIAALLTLAGVGTFSRLGVWQVSRLRERQARNARLEARLSAPSMPVVSLPVDSSLGHYHRVTAHGVLDHDAQVVLVTRSRQGSPGVHLLTPLRMADGRVTMVNRGWVYADDAKTVDLTRWREHAGDTVLVTGYAETWWGRDTSVVPGVPRAVRELDSALVARKVGVPVLPYYVVQTSDSAPAPDRPVRLGEPVLDDGSHRSYAIQWFSFAIIALVGGTLLVRESMRRA